MAKKITQLTAANAANLDGTALMEMVDALGASVKTTLSQLATAISTIGLAASVGIGTAALTNQQLAMGGSVTASAGFGAIGIAVATTLVAAANGNQMRGVSIAPTRTPGTFTGLVAANLLLGAYSVAAFTSPADPTQLDIGVLTGTGATNAYGIRIAPPTGATNNYLLAHTTASTFNVTAAGAGTYGSTLGVASTTAIGTLAPQSNLALLVFGAITSTSGTQRGIDSRNVVSSAATTEATGVYSMVSTAAAAFTVANAYGLFVDTPTIGATSAITTGYGVFIAAQTGPGTHYGLYTNDRIGISSAAAATAGNGTDIILGGSTQTTIGANGAASALTANPLGYLIFFKGATKCVIPYYNG